jgi:hypothetical protein
MASQVVPALKARLVPLSRSFGQVIAGQCFARHNNPDGAALLTGPAIRFAARVARCEAGFVMEIT